MTVSFKHIAGFAIAAVLGTAAATQASPVLKSGDTVDGWKITFPAGISLAVDAANNLVLEKQAAFTNIEGLVITFNQVSYSASPTITITDESLTNVSGKDWSAFQFLLLNTLAGNAADAKFTGQNFTDTTPLPVQTKSDDTITMSGGVLHDTDTAKWGFGANGGELVMQANPATSGLKKVFDFKEIPVVGVPLPTAAWSGLTGLLGLGLLGSAKKVKKILA
jgi:hypothetical protein